MSTLASGKMAGNNSQHVYYLISNNQHLFDEDYPIAWKANTGERAFTQKEIDVIGSNSISNNRQFIKLQQAFDQQKEFLSDYLPEIEEKFKYSLESLLNFSPDKISLQVTNDQSIFYTILKGDFTIYFEHFITDESDSDEVIVSIFKKDENIINFAGSYSDALKELYAPEITNISIFEFA